MNGAKYFVFALCLAMAFSNVMISVWDHNTGNAAAWASAFFGWLSALLANLAKDSKCVSP